VVINFEPVKGPLPIDSFSATFSGPGKKPLAVEVWILAREKLVVIVQKLRAALRAINQEPIPRERLRRVRDRE
jgi:hypothetical protein